MKHIAIACIALCCLIQTTPFPAIAQTGFSPAQYQYDLPPSYSLPIQNIVQQTPVWCWVAVAQQVINYVQGSQNTPSQCALVALANNVPTSTCCRRDGSINRSCVVPGPLTATRDLIQYFSGRPSYIAPPASPQALYETLRSGRPIILSLQPGPGIGHVVVLRGMSFRNTRTGPQALVFVNDPLLQMNGPILFTDLMTVWRSAIVVN